MQVTIVLIFQPAEERGLGAKDMIQENVLEDVEAIFGLHLATKYPLGVVASRPRDLLAGCGSFKAKIKGDLAGPPRRCFDPVLAASASVISLQNIVSREVDPLDSQVYSNTQFVFGRIFQNQTFTHKFLWLIRLAGGFRGNDSSSVWS